MSVQHVYVDLLCAGDDLELDDPAVATRLGAYGRCSEDFRGRLTVARAERAD